MSLFYNNNAGVLLPVSGLNGQSGELVVGVSAMKSGSKTSDTSSWASQESGTFSIGFDTPMPDADYIVEVTIDKIGVSHEVTDKTANGFECQVMNVQNNTIPSTITMSYKAFKLYTASDVTKLQNDVADLQTVTNTTVAVPSGGIRLYKCGRIVQASFQIVGDSLASNFTAGSWVNYGSSGIIPSAYRPITNVYCGQQIVETPVLMRVTTGGNLYYYYSGGTMGYEYEWTQTWISAT